MENKEIIKEISLEELDKIEGRLVVYRGMFDKCWVVNDKTGEVIGQYSFQGDAVWAAGSKGANSGKTGQPFRSSGTLIPLETGQDYGTAS